MSSVVLMENSLVNWALPFNNSFISMPKAFAKTFAVQIVVFISPHSIRPIFSTA